MIPDMTTGIRDYFSFPVSVHPLSREGLLRVCAVCGHVIPSWSGLAWMSLHRRYQSRTSLFHMLPPMLYNPRKLIMFLPMRIVYRDRKRTPENHLQSAIVSLTDRRVVYGRGREDTHCRCNPSLTSCQQKPSPTRIPTIHAIKMDLQKRRTERTSGPTRFPPWWTDNLSTPLKRTSNRGSG